MAIDSSNIVVKNTFLTIQEEGDCDDPWVVDPANCRRQKTDSLIDRSSLSRQRELGGPLGASNNELVNALASLGLKGMMVPETPALGEESSEAGEPETELPAPEPAVNVPIVPVPGGMGEHTTVMVRNIPCKYTQAKLMREINGAGFLGRFDFIYLPMDPRSKANRGFAFCNFDCPEVAEQFYQTYHGRKLRHFASDKVVEVVPADIQGFENNAEHYMSARANGRIRSSHSRPLFLRPLPAHLTADQGGGYTQPAQLASKDFMPRMVHPMASGMPLLPQYVGLSGPPAPFDPFAGSTPMPPLPAAMGPAALGPPAAAGGHGGSVAAAAPARPAPVSAVQEMRFCPYCGNEKKGDFPFCPYCGSQQPSQAPSLQQGESERVF